MSGPRRYGTGFGAVEEEGLESLNAEIPTLKSEDAMEGIEEEGDDVLERLFALLSNSRVQLARAVEEANQLNISDEEEKQAQQAGPSKKEEMPDEETLAKMTAKERELAIKRARNREAARRSRQRKNERISQLYRDIKSLQQENLILLKCIEDFTQKAITSKEEQLEMKEQLANLAAGPSVGHAIPMEEEPAAVQTAPPRVSPVGGLALPSFEELQKLAGEGGQLTARSGTLSARGAAVAEHMAMLSKENSPRDDEEGAAGGSGGDANKPGNDSNNPPQTNLMPVPEGGEQLLAEKEEKSFSALPPSQDFSRPAAAGEDDDADLVDVNALFQSWDGSSK